VKKGPIQGRGVGVRSKSGQRSANAHSTVHFYCAPTWSYSLQTAAVGTTARWSLAMASLPGAPESFEAASGADSLDAAADLTPLPPGLQARESVSIIRGGSASLFTDL